jgi:hypothetical protein
MEKMQLFLVSENFAESARLLDYRRLGKERIEAFQVWQILKELEELNPERLDRRASWEVRKEWLEKAIRQKVDPTPRWKGNARHPIVLMWTGYRNAVAHYYNCHLKEWEARGYKNIKMKPITDYEEVEPPDWIEDVRLLETHRAALLQKELTRKEKPHYQLLELFTKAPEFIDYIWRP